MTDADVRVDYDAISEIARRIRSEAGSIDATRLRAPEEAEVGHARLTDALTHFASKWNASVEHAQDSTKHLATNIESSLEAYSRVDGEVAKGAQSAQSGPPPK